MEQKSLSRMHINRIGKSKIKRGGERIARCLVWATQFEQKKQKQTNLTWMQHHKGTSPLTDIMLCSNFIFFSLADTAGGALL